MGLNVETDTDRVEDRWRCWLRWSGRLVGLGAGALWLLVLGLIELGGEETLGAEGALLTVLMAGAFGGALLAVWHEHLGAWMVLGAGLSLSAFALLTSGRNHWLAVLVAGGPFVVSGLCLLSSSQPRLH